MMNILFLAQVLEIATDPILSEIRENTALTANNTHLDFVWGQWCLIAIISAAAGAITCYNIFMQYLHMRISRGNHKRLFEDIIRHLYRNKVCILAMYAKYNFEKKNHTNAYPSEDHYLKLQVLPEDLRIDLFNRDRSDKWGERHKLALEMRNYNIEAVNASAHIKDPNVDMETKIRDFKSLNYKTGQIAYKIIKFANLVYPEEGLFFKYQTIVYIRRFLPVSFRIGIKNRINRIKSERKKNAINNKVQLIAEYIIPDNDFRARALKKVIESLKESKDGNPNEELYGTKYKLELEEIRANELENDKFLNIFATKEERNEYQKILADISKEPDKKLSFKEKNIIRYNQMLAEYQQILTEDTIIQCGKTPYGVDLICMVKNRESK